MVNKIQLVLVALLLAPSWSYGASVLDLINGKAANYDKTQRKALARNLDQLFKSLDNAVPSLKPSERKWVDDEQSAISLMTNKEAMYKRLTDLHESVEFQQHDIKRLVTSVRGAIDCVIKAKDIQKEIYCWSIVSFYLTDKGKFDGAIAILKRGRKLYDTGALHIGGPNSGYGLFYDSFGRGIQEYFVIPFLAGRLKK